MKAVVDCNSFYCSCERVFKPKLEKSPVVVLSNNDGCIISLSDEAKNMGINMTVPYYMAKPIIEENGVAVFSSNYNLYGDMSRRVMETLKTLLPQESVEVYSVDEAFLDLGQVPGKELNSLAINLRHRVEMWTGIKVSIGVAPTKVLSKLANRLAKKNKEKTNCVLVLATRDEIDRALGATLVNEIWGIGRRYADKLHERWGITTALELSRMSEEWARKNLGGVVGVRLLKELKGEPCIEMKDPLEKKKMIATTRMFGRPVTELCELKEAVATYTSRVAEKLRRQFCAARVVDVFLVTNDYEGDHYRYNPQTKHKTITLPNATSITSDLIDHAVPLVEKLYSKGSRYLKAGVIMSGLIPDNSIQGNLFVSAAQNMQRVLMSAVDNINFSMRDDTVKYVASGLKRNWKMRQELRSPKYTTRWDELLPVK